MIYEEITHKIIGCAMKVHSVLVNGFQEVIYQRAWHRNAKNGIEFYKGNGNDHLL